MEARSAARTELGVVVIGGGAAGRELLPPPQLKKPHGSAVLLLRQTNEYCSTPYIRNITEYFIRDTLPGPGLDKDIPSQRFASVFRDVVGWIVAVGKCRILHDEATQWEQLTCLRRLMDDRFLRVCLFGLHSRPDRLPC
jgi:hypothetical protein